MHIAWFGIDILAIPGSEKLVRSMLNYNFYVILTDLQQLSHAISCGMYFACHLIFWGINSILQLFCWL